MFSVPDATTLGVTAAPTASAITTQLPALTLTSKSSPTITGGDNSVDTSVHNQNDNDVPPKKEAVSTCLYYV